MDDRFGLGREILDASGDAIIKARANCDQAIRVADRCVGAVRAVHPEHSEAQRIGGGEGAKAHQRLAERNAEPTHQLSQFGRCTRPLHTTTDVEERLFTLLDRLDCALDLAGIALYRWLVAAQIDLVRVLEGMLGLLNVLWNIDEDRSGAAGACDVERFLDNAREILDVLDEIVVLCARTRDTHDVGFLEGVVADHRGRHLSGDDDHRRRVHIGVGNPSDGVRRAGSRRYHHDTGTAADAGVALSHVRRALLMAYQYVFNLWLFEKRIVGGQNGAPWISEDHVDAFGDKTLDYDLGPRELLHGPYTSRSLICRDQRRLHHYHNAAQRACGSLPFKPSRARRALDVRQRSTSLETRKAHSTGRENQKLRSKRMSPKRTSLPLETIADPCTG